MPNHTKRPVIKRNVLKRLGTYLLAHKKLVVLAFVLMLSSNLLSLIGPTLAGWAVDAIGTVAGEVQFPRVFYFCGLMLLCYGLSAILSYLLERLMIVLSQKIAYQIRRDIFEKLVDLPVRFFDTHQIGDIISRFSYDVDTVTGALSGDLLQVCTSFITVAGACVMMLLISPKLALVFVITVPTAIFLTKYMTGKVRPLFRERSKKLGELNGFTEETLTGQKTIRAYHRQAVMTERFDVKNKQAVDAYYRADYYGSMVGPSVNFINNLSQVLTSLFGALLYLQGGITLGNLSSYLLYSRKFSGPINEMANILAQLQSATSAAERIFALIDEAPEPKDIEGAAELTDVKGRVELSHVCFGYTPDKVVLRDLSLVAKQGKMVAIVGPTGAGKTTLINLLMRFYDPDKGTVSVDGNDISGVTRKSLRKAYAMVLQDTWLFHGTIFENIAYGNRNATYEQVVNAAKAAKLHPYIMSLPDEYDTVLTENASSFSQGQKQLLTIARAMLLDAEILILDEATSNVDARTEHQIRDAMQTLMKGKTSFVIAHRLSTIQNADLILVVQDGDIVEQGTHAELLKRGGAYAKLYHAQFQS